MSTSRRPNQRLGKVATDYLTCSNCVGIYSANYLRHHFINCTKIFLRGERIVEELGRAVEGRLHAEASDELRTVISSAIREDEVVLLIRYDWIIILFGNDLCLNYMQIYQYAMIRSDFASLYHVKNCNLVIDAIRSVAKFDSISKRFKSPGTASALVTLINTIGDLLIIEYMKLEDEDKDL